MFKKILMFSFFITALNFSSVFAGDAEKGKKLYKKCAACHNALQVEQNTKQVLTYGVYMVPKLACKKVTNIQTG